MDACALCGGRDLEDLFSQTDFVYHTTDETFLHARCRGCGLMFIRKRPTPAAMGRYYPSSCIFYRPGKEVFSFLPACRELAERNQGDDLDLVARKR
ncbi:MAG: hypothetical protein Q8T11_18675 [Elusimicrobiota bacterium]|nr:hypothetical protein [Elusimicrobiota bacterium]